MIDIVRHGKTLGFTDFEAFATWLKSEMAAHQDNTVVIAIDTVDK